MSAEEASLIRAPIPQDHPRFSAPLFHTILAFAFLVHVPAIFLNVPVTEHFMIPADGSDELLALRKVLRTFPGQTWALAIIPVALALASVLRADRRKALGYSEVWAKKLVDGERDGLAADATIVNETKT